MSKDSDPTTIRIEVNGRPLDVRADACLDDVAAEAGVAPGERGVAVALGGTVVPRDDWSTTPLQPGDRLEVVRATAGG